MPDWAGESPILASPLWKSPPGGGPPGPEGLRSSVVRKFTVAAITGLSAEEPSVTRMTSG